MLYAYAALAATVIGTFIILAGVIFIWTRNISNG